jgi:polyferredoxin
MEDNKNVIESLLEKAVDYGKTSYELIKLKALDKGLNFVSSFIPQFFVCVLIAVFMLFFSLGLAFWLGEILGKIYYGFLIVAGFYLFAGTVIHFLLHRWLKKIVSDYFIKRIFR